MKLYRIVRHDGLWHVRTGEPEHAIGASDDREHLTQLARKLAARSEGEVHVCDEAGKLEVIYAYPGGVESFRFPRPPRLRVVRSAPATESE
jgi:hypothetical protein